MTAPKKECRKLSREKAYQLRRESARNLHIPRCDVDVAKERRNGLSLSNAQVQLQASPMNAPGGARRNPHIACQLQRSLGVRTVDFDVLPHASRRSRPNCATNRATRSNTGYDFAVSYDERSGNENVNETFGVLRGFLERGAIAHSRSIEDREISVRSDLDPPLRAHLRNRPLEALSGQQAHFPNRVGEG